MHNSVKQFIKQVRKELPHKFRFRKVLEVGSKNINGSPRKYFWFCNYTGIDISKGKGVDVVADVTWTIGWGSEQWLQDLMSPQYGVVISTEMLEHCEDWEKALYTMYYLLNPGGLLIITCASDDREPHGTDEHHPEASPDTNGYYRNISKGDFKSVLPSYLFELYILMNARDKQDLYFYGIKK